MEDKQGKNKKKSVTFSESSPVGSEGESSSGVPGESAERKRALASAREQRSLRRQTKDDDDDGTTGAKRTRQGPIKNSGLPSNSKRARRTDDEVIKVPMLTGTLYLYRGLHRRAEFVRKY